MNTSTLPAVLNQLAAPARRLHGTDARWAAAAGIPKETLSRLKKSESCDFRTLAALARAAGLSLAALPARVEGTRMPDRFGRTEEDALLDFCASGNASPEDWAARGPSFFMGGLATLLAGARGFERRRYLELAESLHPGITVPEVFACWLQRTPVRAARFLPLLRKRAGR